MQKYILTFSISVGVILAAPSSVAAQNIPANIIPQIGTVQQQDLDSAKRLEQERRSIRDYKN